VLRKEKGPFSIAIEESDWTCPKRRYEHANSLLGRLGPAESGFNKTRRRLFRCSIAGWTVLGSGARFVQYSAGVEPHRNSGVSRRVTRRFWRRHVIVLGTFSGTAEASAGGPWRVHVLGESVSLQVVDPGASTSTGEEVQQTMLADPVLDRSRFRTIELQSRSLVPGETGRSWRMLADLTLHGVTRQVEFPLSWEQEVDRLRVHGSRKLLLKRLQH